MSAEPVIRTDPDNLLNGTDPVQTTSTDKLIQRVISHRGAALARHELVRRGDAIIPQLVSLFEKQKASADNKRYGALINIIRDIGTPKAKDTLLNIAQNAPNESTRASAIAGLAKFEGNAKEAVPYLNGLLKNDSNPFHYNGIEIKDSNDPAAQIYRQQAIRHEQLAAVYTLKKIDTVDAKNAIANYTELQKNKALNNDFTTRSNALYALEILTYKDRSGIIQFRKALTDENIRIRLQAAKALLDQDDCKKESLQVLQEALKNTDSDIQCRAVTILKNYARKDQSAETYLRNAAENDNYLRHVISWGGMNSPWLIKELADIDRKNTFDPKIIEKQLIAKQIELAVVSEDKGNTFLTNNGMFFSTGSANYADHNASITSMLSDGTLNTNFGKNGLASFDLNQLQTLEGNLAHALGIPFAIAWFATTRTLAIDNEHNIFAGGYTRDTCFLLKLKSDGRLDKSFGDRGLVSYRVSTPEGNSLYGTSITAITITTDGKILTLGHGLWNRTLQDLRESLILAKFTADGKLDKTFGKNGMIIESPEDDVNLAAEKLLIQQNGKIIIAINIPHQGSFLQRYNPDGSTDLNFGTNSRVKLEKQITTKVLTEENNKLLVAGFYETPCERHNQEGGTYIFAEQLSANGKLDTIFGTGGIINEILACLEPTLTNYPLLAVNDHRQLNIVFKKKGVQVLSFDKNGHKL